jgi:hypothetical protein
MIPVLILLGLLLLVIIPDMSRGWQITIYIWCGFWAVIFFAATVPAHQAISNLESWADLFGLTAAAHFVSGKRVDIVTQIASGIGFVLGLANYAIKFHEWRRARR